MHTLLLGIYYITTTLRCQKLLLILIILITESNAKCPHSFFPSYTVAIVAINFLPNRVSSNFKPPHI